MKSNRFKWPFRKRTKRRLVTAFFSVFLSALLFLTVASGEGANKGTSNGEVSSTYSHTLENVPINFHYDSKDYYISGHASSVNVVLTSSNRVNLATEIDQTTRNIEVVADLSDLSEGTSKVQLQVEKLPSGMTAKVDPNTVTVTIGKRASKKFTVKADIDNSRIAQGYYVAQTSISKESVKVTSSEMTLNQIDHVRASLPEDVENISEDYEDEVNLQAVDKNGNILPATIDPQTVNLKLFLSTYKSKSSSSSH